MFNKCDSGKCFLCESGATATADLQSRHCKFIKFYAFVDLN
ncbi:hypothetical protein [Lysinibacillus sp. TE18511]